MLMGIISYYTGKWFALGQLVVYMMYTAVFLPTSNQEGIPLPLHSAPK